MKKIITTSLAGIAIVAGVIVAPLVAEATTINDNRGSIIKLSGNSTVTAHNNAGSIIKASGTAANVSNNSGSIIKIDGKGQNINDVLNSAEVSNNKGSIIKITNVCGTVNDPSKINGNKGSIIKVESNGTCTVTPAQPVTPSAPVIPAKPAASVTPETPVSNPKAGEMPAELPQTGVSSTALIASILGVVTAGVTYVIRRGQ
jgi:LPXTG-motif cell wall-anchored protein